MISVWCPNCGQDCPADDDSAGRSVICPDCNLLIFIPSSPAVRYDPLPAIEEVSPFPAIASLCAIGSLILAAVAITAPLVMADFFAVPSILFSFAAVGLAVFCPRALAGFAALLFSAFALVVSLFVVLVIHAGWSHLSR